MNKGEFIKEVAAKSGLTQKDAAIAYEAMVATLEEALKAGDKVQLVGFGNFEVKERAERTGVNPQTKETVTIPACKVPAFKFGKNFKALLND